MDDSNSYRFSRTAPPIMSLLALAICTLGWAGIVRAPPADEGPLAHFYQLVMLARIPLILMFAVIAVGRGLRRNVGMLGLQVALWISGLAAVPVLGW